MPNRKSNLPSPISLSECNDLIRASPYKATGTLWPESSVINYITGVSATDAPPGCDVTYIQRVDLNHRLAPFPSQLNRLVQKNGNRTRDRLSVSQLLYPTELSSLELKSPLSFCTHLAISTMD